MTKEQSEHKNKMLKRRQRQLARTGTVWGNPYSRGKYVPAGLDKNISTGNR